MAAQRIKCPYCAEEILPDAKKCRFCGEWLVRLEDSDAVMVDPVPIFVLLQLTTQLAQQEAWQTSKQGVWGFAKEVRTRIVQWPEVLPYEISVEISDGQRVLRRSNLFSGTFRLYTFQRNKDWTTAGYTGQNYDGLATDEQNVRQKLVDYLVHLGTLGWDVEDEVGRLRIGSRKLNSDPIRVYREAHREYDGNGHFKEDVPEYNAATGTYSELIYQLQIRKRRTT